MVTNTYINGFVIFITVIILPVVCIMAYKKYFKRLLRQIQTNLSGHHTRNTRAKWRRHQTYEKVNNHEPDFGCDDIAYDGNNVEISLSDEDSETETENLNYSFGEERRRLLYNSNGKQVSSSSLALPSEVSTTSVNI